MARRVSRSLGCGALCGAMGCGGAAAFVAVVAKLLKLYSEIVR